MQPSSSHHQILRPPCCTYPNVMLCECTHSNAHADALGAFQVISMYRPSYLPLQHNNTISSVQDPDTYLYTVPTLSTFGVQCHIGSRIHTLVTFEPPNYNAIISHPHCTRQVHQPSQHCTVNTLHLCSVVIALLGESPYQLAFTNKECTLLWFARKKKKKKKNE
jgi:hypothetical protein